CSPHIHLLAVPCPTLTYSPSISHTLLSRIPPPPRSTLFPYTTLFRSQRLEEPRVRLVRVHALAAAGRLAVGGPRVDTTDQSDARSEEHTSELQSRVDLVCRLLLEKKKKKP